MEKNNQMNRNNLPPAPQTASVQGYGHKSGCELLAGKAVRQGEKENSHTRREEFCVCEAAIANFSHSLSHSP